MTIRMKPEALQLLADYNAIRERVQAAADKRELLTQLTTRQLAGLALSILPITSEAQKLLTALQQTHGKNLNAAQHERLRGAIALLARC